MALDTQTWIAAIGTLFACIVGMGTAFWALHKQTVKEHRVERQYERDESAKERERDREAFLNTLATITNRFEGHSKTMQSQLAEVSKTLASLLEWQRIRPRNERKDDPR